jgi:outer membrane protein assembly factor BamB
VAPGKLAYGVGATLGLGRLVVPTADRLQELDTLGTVVAVGQDNTGLGMSEPAIGPDGTLYVQVPHTNGLMAFRRPDQELWRQRGFRSRWTWYGGPALAAGGVLYVAAMDGFYAVDVSSSGAQVRWRFPPDPRDSLVFVGAPLIGRDGTVYSFTSCTNGEETFPCSDELFAFWEDKPVEPDSPWPMWRHDARRSGQAHR